MSGPRLSYNAETARSAVEQAEWNVKKWVWVPDTREGYVAGYVHSEDEESAEVVLDSGRQIRRVRFEELFKMNPPKFDRVEDIADLTFLNEASVVHNLRLRYGSGAIYTYSGLFLVAINPYQNLPLYSDAIVQQYRGKRRDENPPHIFAVAERAWVSMGEERENQSILITGESGAGKTESTKKVIQYLASIAIDVHLPSSTAKSSAHTSSLSSSFLRRTTSRKGHVSSPSITGSSHNLSARGRLGLLERQILQANPILEAFGNAQTQRNNNSSRFGKFVRIMFSPDGSIAGANIDWYLLEKSRVVYRNESERSFHVFYQLLSGGSDDLKGELLLDGGIADYQFLNKSRREIDGVDDREEWNILHGALETVGFDSNEQFDLFRVVAAILHIGNITITSSRSDDAVMPDPSQAERVCHLLGIPIAEFTRAVLRPRALAGREWVTQARTRQQALDELCALCKTLYEKLFGALVERINRALDRPSSRSTFIGVLDIAGFEIFEVNGYEQLLINYTNEKLQQCFNHHMFVLEQEEYARESIHWDYVNFGLDLQPTIDLIEASGNVIGVLSCLDEECIMPKADDKTFTNKLNAIWASNTTDDDSSHPGTAKYEASRFEQGFIIQHYAAKVEYRTDGWLEKNKDPLNDDLTRVLAASTERYVAVLFSDHLDTTHSGHGSTVRRRMIKKGAFRTVAHRHKEQLASLMTQLKSTQPHFVRCIVPNTLKKPGRMDVPLVLDQLRCNGVLEGIRIARLGYPNRLPFIEFRQRYEILTPGILPQGYMDGREACRRMVHTLELDESMFKLGTSKIFFKAGVLAELEEKRDAILFDIFSRIQAASRMCAARRQMRKILHRAVAVRVIQKNARVYGDLREWPWWQLYTKVRPLLAATRNDEELRKKEMELALVRERAERDKQEREALERLQMALEAEKRKVEDELEAERALTLDKDTLLERSKKREADLEEEVHALQSDIDTLDSQVNRAMHLQNESEEKYEKLREAFDQAADHLVRLEQELQLRDERELELKEQVKKTTDEIDGLHSELDQLQKVSQNLEGIVSQREESLARAKEREESTIVELRGKLEVEIQNKNLFKERADQLDEQARHTRDQLSELTRTASDYCIMITKKEDQIDTLTKRLEALRTEYDNSCVEIMALRADVDTLDGQLTAAREDHNADILARDKLVEERDELRVLLATKTSEETRRSEVEKSRELELAELRGEVAKLHHDLSQLKRSALEAQNKARLELEQITRDHSSLQSSHDSLLNKEQSIRSQFTTLQAQLLELERAKRTLESELLSSRTRLHEHEGQLADAFQVKESLERQLLAALDEYRAFENMASEYQQERDARSRDLQSVRGQLETETAKRTQLEKTVISQKAELSKIKEQNNKLGKDLTKALKDLKDREWDVKQLESKQDKTIVEHVHVLEEAKRVTDKELVRTQTELEKKDVIIRSLQTTKSKMQGEAEDLAFKYSRELRSKEHELKDYEKRVSEALVNLEKERRGREEAELNIHRVQTELRQARQQAEEFSERFVAAERSRNALEDELERLVEETEGTTSFAKMQREYETRVHNLESRLDESEMSRVVATNIRDLIERQLAELRKVVVEKKSTDKEFYSELVRAFQKADTNLKKELSVRPNHPRLSGAGDYQSISPRASPRKSLNTPSNAPQNSVRGADKQTSALKYHVQLLETQMAASTRIRKHLETTVRELTSELERADGSRSSMERYKANLIRENERLTELLNEESAARGAADAQVTGLQAMWDIFQKTIVDERDKYTRLEESRKALIVQQRAAQAELEAQYAKMQDTMNSKKVLQQEVDELKEEQEVLKIEAENAKKQLQKLVQEDEVMRSTSAASQSELRTIIETMRASEQMLQSRYETTEMERVNAVSAEHKAVRQLAEVEATSKKASEDHKKSLKAAERRIKELEGQIERNRRSSSETGFLQQRIAEELAAERERHRMDLAEHDLKIDQTRTRHQVKLAELSEELQSQRELLSHNREENRKLKSDLTNLQVLYDHEISKSTGWRKEKERLETKIVDLERVCEASSGAQAEQQSQIVSLHSQLRELRGVLDEAEVERALLQKARRALQAELESIKIDHSDKVPNDQEYQKMQLRKQELERLADEQEDRIAYSNEKVKKAESFANNCQIELGKLRVENSKLDKVNAKLEKQAKELGARIKDLEARPLLKLNQEIRHGDDKAELTDTKGRRSNNTGLANGKRLATNTP